jgi:phosphopantetheinyl transferase (holo-ACP synthase)
LHDVEVVGGGESLRLELHGGARARADELGGEIALSLTHSRDTAAAVVVIR